MRLRGLVIGVVLELIWVLDIPIGAFVPADATISTVSATAIAALGSPGDAPLPVIGFSILLTSCDGAGNYEGRWHRQALELAAG